MRVFGALSCALFSSCAFPANPPGGPEDPNAPLVLAIEPDSGTVLSTVPGEVTIQFDEVISERVAGTPPDIHTAVILSPVTGDTRVRWRRDRITVRPRDGFRPGIVYRVEVLPVINDLRQNRLREGRTVVFTTGPAMPAATLRGAVVDWVAARPVPRALVEAVLMPDSLPYRTVSDSTGFFEMRQLPAGTYVVYGIVDANSDRRGGTREAFDSVRITLDSAAQAELYAFPHDTLAPRLRQVEIVDSLTLRLTFDRPLDPALSLDTSGVHLAPAEDSTAHIGVAAVMTRADFDSLRARAARVQADSAAAARARPDSVRPPRPDSARAPARPVQQPGGIRPAAGRAAPLDSTLAQRMIARRPSPSDVRMVILQSPLTPDARYFVLVDSARSLTGQTGTARSQIRAPRAAAGRAP